MKAREVVLGLLMTAALCGAPAAIGAQPMDRAGDRWDQSHVTGVISTIQGSSVQLDNGRVVFLHHGTVINPTGTRLQVGMRIAVLGSPSSNDAIDANEIDIGPGPSDLSGVARYHSTYTSGTIATVQGSSVQLDNGRVIFLHHGTVIAPTGTRLQPGMQIAVLGSPSSHDAIDANVVTVAGTSATGQ